MQNILEHFRLDREKEKHQFVIDEISKGVTFKGANLWVLIFAIFIASLGLNVNSTAVIIGAMLISPLMGPIMGLGLGMGTTDLPLLKKSFTNYLLATAISLASSTLYFLLTPINDAHSEILARTSPNIYDVLIAFFGGLAGILAISSKYKGNVLPGVAIATALMPPLCTAGYGLATLQWTYFMGAFYLFIINTVFIALATLITVRFLRFPIVHQSNPLDERRVLVIVWVLVTATLVPSIYLGYDLVQQHNYIQAANRFIALEAVFPRDYLLEKNIDAQKRNITLIYGGERISAESIAQIGKRLGNYGLEKTDLIIKQGFESLSIVANKGESIIPLKHALAEKSKALDSVAIALKELQATNSQSRRLLQEANVLWPNLRGMAIAPVLAMDSTATRPPSTLVYLNCAKLPKADEKRQMEHWFRSKIDSTVHLVIQLYH